MDLPPDPADGRTRYIGYRWVRSPHGGILPTPPPKGMRTPNNIKWAHSLSDIYWIAMHPDIPNAVSMWTRSMVKEFGDAYDETEFPEPEPAPCVKHPWPVLATLAENLIDAEPILGGDEEAKASIAETESMHAVPDIQPEDDKMGAITIEPSTESVEAQPSAESAKQQDAAVTQSDQGKDDDAAPAKVKTDKKKTKTSNPYSTKDLPKLEEFIPEAYFPDILLVHDPESITLEGIAVKIANPSLPKKYKRTLPEGTSSGSTEPAQAPRVAELYLEWSNQLGVGHHSFVYRAPLTLPHPLTAASPTGQVTVAAKTAFPNYEARALLYNEAQTYASFEKHMMEDWSGYNIVSPMKYPVPVGAVVPKFYGYYERVLEEGEVEHGPAEYSIYRFGASPILLLEECGEPVQPRKFSVDDRSECYSLMLRLHLENVVQGSFYVRNILMQPGPLTAPPHARSTKTPSFRIIDFGRAEARKDVRALRWREAVGDEDKKAHEELHIKEWEY